MSDNKTQGGFDFEIPRRWLALSAAILALVTILSFLAMYGYFQILEQFVAEKQPDVTPLRAEYSTTRPTPPLLPEPERVLAHFRAEEDVAVSEYAWVDENEGLVRLPLERALELVVEEGLPTWTPAPEATPTETEVTDEAAE